MTLSFIGAGKVGTAVGMYFSSHAKVLYYLSHTEASAKRAAEYVGCLYTDNLEQLILASDIIFITTGDNAIEDVARRISTLDVALESKVFIHMSGALTTKILDALKVKGARVCSLHPLQTFSSVEQGFKDLEQAYFALEGDELITELIKEKGNEYFVLTQDQKTKYHLSACVFSNYLVTLLDYGSKLLGDIGINQDDGLQAMKPLIEATLKNIYNKGTQEALTGPIQRGDTRTLNAHMDALEGLDLDVYKLLGTLTTERLINDKNKKNVLDELWR